MLTFLLFCESRRKFEDDDTHFRISTVFMFIVMAACKLV